MTAPTAPVPVASQEQAPAAPVAPVAKKASDILSGSSEQLMERFGLKQLADEGRAEDAVAEPVATESPETPDAPAEQPEKQAPDADAAPVVETPKREPIAKFQIFDKDGEVEIPDVTIAFTANGKERKEPLDKVVRLAQQGFYNEEREQQVAETRKQATEIRGRNEQLEGYVTALRRDLQQLLNDPSDALYQQLKAEHARANTPEARLQRAERALVEERQRGQQTIASQQAAVFADTLSQHLTQLTEAHPEVSFEEILGRFNTIAAPLMQAGQVPVERFGDVAQLVDQELTPWVQHRHESRVEVTRKRDADANEKVEREKKARQSQSILHKRQIARAVPSTAGTITQPLTPKSEKPQYKRADDILKDVTRIVQTASG